MQQLFFVLLGVNALIRREETGIGGPLPRDGSSHRCEHRVFPVEIPTDLTFEKMQLVADHLNDLIENRGLSIDRDRNTLKAAKSAVALFEATDQWQQLIKLMQDTAGIATEGKMKGIKVPFVNYDPLTTDANVWSWFAAERGQAEPILEDFLRGFFAHDYEKIAGMVGELKWGKSGSLHLDFPSRGVGLTLWVLLPPKFVKALDGVGGRFVKMRFSLVQISGQEALVEAVAEETSKDKVKQVFQKNHFRECDMAMMNDLRDFNPTKADEDASGKLKDLFGRGDTREKNLNCVIPEKVFNPQVTQATDDGFRKLVADAMNVPGGVNGVGSKRSDYHNALVVADSTSGLAGSIFNNLGGGQSYTHGGDMFPRWYFYVMQQCAESSASSCPTCQKYNKAPSRWGPFVDTNALKKPPNSYLAIRSD